MLEDALLEVAQEDKYGKTEIANAGEILRVLRGEVDAEAFEEWIRRAVIFLQSKKVLLSWLHGEDEDGELQAKERENREGTSKENYAVIALRRLWEEWQNASTPHRRKPSEQLAGELDKTLLELSRETASVEKFMCCVRIAAKGEGFMPEALPADAKETKAICFQQNQREEVRSLGEQTGAIAANAGAHQTNYVCESAAGDAQGSAGRGVWPTVAGCLRARGDSSPCVDNGQPFVCYALDQQGGKGGANYSENIAPPLMSDSHGTPHGVCYAVRTRNTMANGWGVAENAYTLDTSEGQAVAYSVDCRNMNLTKEHGTLQAKENGGQSLNYLGAVCYPIDSHQQDSRFKICEDGVCPTVPGQMGTGGNNGPMVLETFQNTGRGWWNKSDIAQTVRTPCGGDSTKANLVITKTPRKYIIRRLTPLECLRLQGLPDGWLDGVDGSDSAKYKMLGNGIAMPNAIYVVGCAVQLLQEGKHENEG